MSGFYVQPGGAGSDFKDGLKVIKEAMYQGGGTFMRPSMHYARTTQTLRPYRTAYDGGDDAVRFLIKRPGETGQQWRSRQHHFENVPLIETVVQELASGAYGNAPKRCVKYRVEDGIRSDEMQEQDAALDEAFNNVYEANEADALFRDDVSTHVFRDGYCGVKTWARLDSFGLSLGALPPEFCFFVGDPSDNRTYFGVVELVKSGSTFRYWLHTPDWYCEITDGWEIVSGPEDAIVPGIVPITLFGRIMPYGKHPMATLLQQQRSAINDQSTRQLGKRAQAFSVPVMSGTNLIPPSVDPVTGEQYQRVIGPDGGVHMKEGGTFTFQATNFNLAQITDDNNALLRMYLGMARVSQFALTTTEAPDQPMALAIKERRTLSERQRWINILKPQEKNLAETVFAYSVAMIDDFPATSPDVDITITFDDHILPMDRMAERQTDAADVAAGRATIKWYVGKWIMPDANEQEIEQYLAEIQADSTARTDRLGSVLNPPSRVGGSDLLSGFQSRIATLSASSRNGAEPPEDDS